MQRMKFHADHGCYLEEKKAGNTFIVDLEYNYPSANAEESDSLHDTLDYSLIYQVISEEMNVHSNLIEHLGRRIIKHIKSKFTMISGIKLKITKCNPPLGKIMEGVAVEFEE